LEDDNDLEKRISTLQGQLQRLMDGATKYIQNANQLRNADQLMSDSKLGSGLINEHATITKDKMGELKLRMFLVSQRFARFDRVFERHLYQRNDRLLQYQSARMKYILTKYVKLHEDLQFEFREELNNALAFAHQSGMQPYMEALGLPNEV